MASHPHLNHPNKAGVERMFQAMMEMDKLDIKKLKDAFNGK
jgi:hypothetical protein